MSVKPMMMPIISKVYCSSTPVVLVVRRRPRVVNGGGFVVTDCGQKVVFRVEGCGILGKKEELLLRDGDGEAILLIRRKVLFSLSLQQQQQKKSRNSCIKTFVIQTYRGDAFNISYMAMEGLMVKKILLHPSLSKGNIFLFI